MDGRVISYQVVKEVLLEPLVKIEDREGPAMQILQEADPRQRPSPGKGLKRQRK